VLTTGEGSLGVLVGSVDGCAGQRGEGGCGKDDTPWAEYLGELGTGLKNGFK
jgi:hypothetical protein